MQLNADDRKLLQQTFALVQAFAKEPMLAMSAVERMYVQLIETRGVEVCLLIIWEVLARLDRDQCLTLLPPIFLAFAKQRKLKEARQVMAQMKLGALGRMNLYGGMAEVACEEDRQELVQKMRTLLTFIEDGSERFEAYLKIFQASREVSDFERVRSIAAQRFRDSLVGTRDLKVVIELAACTDGVQLMRDTIRALEKTTVSEAVRVSVMKVLQTVAMWDRARLLELANELPGSPLEPEIRRLAAAARDMDEMRRIESEESEGAENLAVTL